MKQLTMQIASVPDRENVVSEIWFENDQVAEISSEVPGKFVIEIYASPEGGGWSFDLDAFQLILSRARDNLTGE
jgi:hypothetical protein